jgi:hypothetical protein
MGRATEREMAAVAGEGDGDGDTPVCERQGESRGQGEKWLIFFGNAEARSRFEQSVSLVYAGFPETRGGQKLEKKRSL